MLNTYQRETKLFEFSWKNEQGRVEDKKNRCHFAMAWFSLLPSAFFIKKLPSFLKRGYTKKYRPVFKDVQANENTALAVQIFLK